MPWVTLALCGAAIAVHVLGGAAALEWSRAGLARGEPWRALTGHLAHWSPGHLAWDVAALAMLGPLVERRGRGHLAALLLASAAAISAGLLLLDPGLDAYRGLSGLDSTLFVAVCGGLARDAWTRRDGLGAVAAALLLVGFVAKVGVEWATGASLFVAPGGGVEVAPLAHVMGCVTASLAHGIGCVTASLACLPAGDFTNRFGSCGRVPRGLHRCATDVARSARFRRRLVRAPTTLSDVA